MVFVINGDQRREVVLTPILTLTSVYTGTEGQVVCGLYHVRKGGTIPLRRTGAFLLFASFPHLYRCTPFDPVLEVRREVQLFACASFTCCSLFTLSLDCLSSSMGHCGGHLILSSASHSGQWPISEESGLLLCGCWLTAVVGIPGDEYTACWGSNQCWWGEFLKGPYRKPSWKVGEFLVSTAWQPAVVLELSSDWSLNIRLNIWVTASSAVTIAGVQWGSSSGLKEQTNKESCLVQNQEKKEEEQHLQKA